MSSSYSPSRQQFYYKSKQQPSPKQQILSANKQLSPRLQQPPPASTAANYAHNYFRQRRERRDAVSVSTSSEGSSAASSSSSSTMSSRIPKVDCLLQTPPVLDATLHNNGRSIQHIPPLADDDDDTDREVQQISGAGSDDTSLVRPSSSSDMLQSALSDMTPDQGVPVDTNMNNTNHMIRLVQQLQQRHDQERTAWKDQLRAAEDKKAQYKLELRQTIANQLEWLEGRLVNATPSEGGPSKTKVLQELLALTDQQHQHEQHQWQAQEQQLQERVLHLESLVEQWKQTSAEAEQWTHERQQLQAQLAAAQAENEDRDALQEELVTEFEASRQETLAQQQRADALEQQLQQLAATTTATTTSNLVRAAPSPKVVQHRVEWEDKLDRAVAERDMLRQEAEHLREQLHSQHPVWFQQQQEALAQELESIKTKYIAEQASWLQQLQAAVATAQKLETDVAAANKKVTELEAGNSQLETSAQQETASWKQQLQDATENSRKLEEALTNEADRHAKEVRELKAHVLQLESQAKQRRAQQQEMEQTWTQEKTELQEKLKESASIWKAAAEKQEQETDKKIRNLLEKHRSEICELAAHLEAVAKENESQPLALQRLTDMAEQHTMEKRQWADTLDASTGENTRLKVEVEQLSQVLVDLKTLHSNTTMNYQTVVNEKEHLQTELERLKANDEELMERKARATEETTLNQTNVIVQSIHDLRSDFYRLQERVSEDARADKDADIVSYLDSFRDDLANIQSSLNDAVAELTLEADAMLESREAIKSVASDASSSLGQQKGAAASRLQEQQDMLLTEVLLLKNNLDTLVAQPRPENALSGDELLNLRKAEVEVAVSRTELAHYREKLEAEIAARQKAESEVGTLIEQADAYEEQLMTLQSLNDNLSRKLHIAGLKIDASLVDMPANEDILSTLATPKPDPTAKSPSARSEDLSVPLLDEALAMAENLTHIVNDGDKKTSLMEMLESMSDMIDAQGVATLAKTPPAFSPPTSPLSCPERRSVAFESPNERTRRYSSISPMERHRKLYDDSSENIEVVHEARSPVSVPDERTPKPVETPVQFSSNVAVRTLQAIVEQLYARCQLLERERAEMMEMSLEMLESVKESSEAEVDAALATARRKASEDLLRMRRETFGSQERVMKKLLKSRS